MRPKRDYYSILGVDKNVTEAELKSAYRKLGKKYHPDVNPDDPGAAAKMQEINEAYEVLSDPVKRAEYNDGGGRSANSANAGKKQPGGRKSGSASDIFGGIKINLDDFDFVDPNKKHARNNNQDGDNKCRRCGGSGKERTTVSSGFGTMTKTRVCSACKGKGII
jgi:molecular chaperone DnaJ